MAITRVIDLESAPAPPACTSALVSVIMPVYQGERLILGAVHSALSQTHTNIELIVVDDGSSDRTLELLGRVRDQRLTVLQQANAGTAAARNRALLHARGDFIAFLDADDRWFPEKIATELRILQQAPDPIGVAYSSYYAVDDTGRLLNPAPKRRLSGNLLDTLLDGEDFLMPSVCLFDRRVFDRVGGFRTARFHEDHDLILRVARDYPIYATGEHLVVYRQSTSGKCRSIIADYDRALREELSLVAAFESEFSGDELNRLRRNVVRGLYCRFLMYGFNGHARRLLPEVELASLGGSKKGLIAQISAKSGINLLIVARLLVQTYYRYFGQAAWRARLAQSCLELAYDGAPAGHDEPTESPASAKAPRVCVAIPTYRRPEQLRSLLEGIALQHLRRPCSVDVVVIDNDTEPTAREAVDAFGAFPFPLRYEHHAEPGLSSVRNFALELALRDYDLLAMIDDDEVPQPQWLDELLRTWKELNADAVIGPVPKTFPVPPPDWIRRGKFYELPRFADGAAMHEGYSGNCLLSVPALRRLDVRFDRQLNLAGGEDLLFFRELRAREARIRYAARAVAFETIGPARLRPSYLLKLSFRRGNSLAFCDLRLKSAVVGTVSRAMKGSARVVLGCALFVPLSLVGGRSGMMRAACSIAQGLGSLAGLTGFVYLGYNRVKPRS